MQDLTFLEFFAGQGQVWKHLRADSIDSVGVDIEYGTPAPGETNPFDILTNAGLG